jgi:phage gpG-like protein
MAASGLGLRVTGLRQVVRGLEKSGVAVTDLKDAFSNVAAMGAQVMRGFVPERSGRLAGTVRGNRAKNKAVVTTGRASVPYAGVINFGWPSRGIEANPFQKKTDEAMEPVALGQLQNEIDQVIRRNGL